MAEQVDVTVSNGNPSCDPDVLEVRGKNVNIKWKMKTSGWSIADITGLPSDVFEDPGKDGKDYKIKDKGAEGTYNYTVVVQSDSGETATQDPSIRNLPD